MSMSFYASDKDGNWVFTRAETTEGEWIETDKGEEFKANPSYRPEFNINMSNPNAKEVIETLGYKVEDGFWSAPINEFLAKARQHLQSRIGKRSEGIEAFAEQEPGKCTVHHCGRREGYIEERLHGLVMFAAEAKNRGAVEIYAS